MFIEQQLLAPVSYGFTGGPTFATTVYELISGKDARNAERTRPLHMYSAPYNLIKPDDRKIIVDAYNACLAQTYGFRFKDWADYLLINEPHGTAEVGTNTIQIEKKYSFGPVGQEISTTRTIVKPVDGTVVVMLDGLMVPSTTDSTTGIVEFNAVGGEAITINGQFDVPVRFTEDRLSFTMENWEANTTEIGLKEDFTA